MSKMNSDLKVKKIKPKIESNCDLASNEAQIVLKKDSFERFDEELSELLLTFLPLNEKFLFESVSKQWKNLIFNKVFVLDVFDLKFKKVLKFLNEDKNHFSINEKVFECVIKKCHNIKHLKIKKEEMSFTETFEDNGSVFELLANNCQHLESIEYYFHEFINCVINDIYFYDKLREFGVKCGLKLQFINIECKRITDNFMKEFLVKTPNVIKVGFNNNSIFDESNGANFLQNLNNIKFRDIIDINYGFKVFTDKYHKQIISISGRLGKTDALFILKQISKFENLRVLNINDQKHIAYSVVIDEALLMIANNCIHLEELSISFSNKPHIFQTKQEFFSIISNFKSLKSLSVHTYFNTIITFGQMSYLSQIETLSKLTFGSIVLKKEFFLNTHTLTNIKSIHFIHSNVLSDKRLEYISKIPNLSSINIEYSPSALTINCHGIRDLVDNCINLRYIKITGILVKEGFNFKCFKCFVKLAIKRLKVMHEFGFKFDEWNLNWKMIRRYVKTFEANPLPKNLIVFHIESIS